MPVFRYKDKVILQQETTVLVVGVNKQFKQEVELGKVNNQNFVQIPYYYLRSVLHYLADRNGICYIEQEESYTSKASFPDRDFIPVYGQEPDEFSFSGKRGPTPYKGMYKANGFRGLYRIADGSIINSDLNASANILRKAFPDAFDAGHTAPDFSNIVIIVHPDFAETRTLHERQKADNATRQPSHAKLKRQRRKAA